MAQLSRSLPEMNRLATRAESFYASPYEREPIYPKIFVGGLPPETCAEDIIQAFASYRIEVVKLPAMKQGQRFAFAPEIEVKSKHTKFLITTATSN